MKIVFCIKGCAIKPIGGHKILYEYANRLADRGYDVTIVFPSEDNLYQLPLPASVRVEVCHFLTDVIHVMPPWFRFNKKVKTITVTDFSEKNFPDADYIIATAAETAVPVFQLPERCGKKIYFIQDYETWTMDEATLCKTFSLGMQNIVISNWLKEKVSKISESEVIHIPNAIDAKKFCITNPIKDRKSYILGMLYHNDKHKGLKYAIEAVKIAKEKHSNIHVIMFGAPKRPDGLPDWFEYHYRVKEDDLVTLYNECAVFVCATIDEGFGLTGAESMACGCAFASTEYKGVLEYAKDGVNSLLSPVKNSQALADNICKLIEDNDLRIKIATEGRKSIENRSWNQAVDMFENKVLRRVSS